MTDTAFLDRVFANLPRLTGRFSFQSWKHGGKPTSEGVGILPESGVDVAALAARIMDVGAYKGNIDYVAECRAISDPRFVPPEAVRFYQRVKVPMLAEIHHELVLTDHGDRDGWRVLGWHMLEAETERLDKKKGARSAYNVGGWLIRPDAVAYALCSAPRKEDVGRLKFAALTKGADAGATKVVQGNIAGMVRWSRR